MTLKFLKPTTPGQRGTVLVDKSKLWKGSPLKSLTIKSNSTGGRNNQGKITSRRKGGGVKQKYRIIDFKRNKFDVFGEVVRNEYDPNRSAFVSLIKYDDGEFRYVISPQKVSVGDKIISSNKAEIKEGNCLPIKNVPMGTNIHNIELKPGAGGQLARSAGASAQISGMDDNYCIIKLNSGEIRKIIKTSRATIGSVSNTDHQNIKIGKAGRNRWRGKRPSVRGVAMNPVDHPHGGGEGKTSGGRSPVSPWGQSAKGLKTRRNKRSNKYIISRKKDRN